MRIFVINPDYGMTKDEIQERCDILQHVVSSDVEIHMECLKTNQIYLDSQLDALLAGSEIVTMAKKAELDGFDAVVLYCFSDPAIAACRELLSIPVIGAGQAAFMAASLSASHFGIIITDAKRILEKKIFVYQTGISPERVTTIEAIDLKDVSIRQDISHIITLLEKTSQKMIASGTGAIILGCLSFLGMGEELSKKINLPVIDPACSALGLAEFMVRQKLFMSKQSYPFPPEYSRKWQAGELNFNK